MKRQRLTGGHVCANFYINKPKLWKCWSLPFLLIVQWNENHWVLDLCWVSSPKSCVAAAQMFLSWSTGLWYARAWCSQKAQWWKKTLDIMFVREKSLWYLIEKFSSVFNSKAKLHKCSKANIGAFKERKLTVPDSFTRLSHSFKSNALLFFCLWVSSQFLSGHLTGVELAGSKLKTSMPDAQQLADEVRI